MWGEDRGRRATRRGGREKGKALKIAAVSVLTFVGSVANASSVWTNAAPAANAVWNFSTNTCNVWNNAWGEYSWRVIERGKFSFFSDYNKNDLEENKVKEPQEPQ